MALGGLLVAAPILAWQSIAASMLWVPDLTLVVLVLGALIALMGATRLGLLARSWRALRLQQVADEVPSLRVVSDVSGPTRIST